MTIDKAWNDAGLLREYIVTRFADYLTSGASTETASRCNRLVKRLAQLTGMRVSEVYQDLHEDAECFLA